jgi:hypothetical protein
MSLPVKVIGTRVIDGRAFFVTPAGGWSEDPAEALEVVIEGDPTVRQLAAADRAVTAFLGGYREQAELSAVLRDLYAELRDECDQQLDPGLEGEAREQARDRVFRSLDSPLKDAFVRARSSSRRAEWVGRWNACFIRGPEAWRKLDAVVADDAIIDTLRETYEEAAEELRVGKAQSSGR